MQYKDINAKDILQVLKKEIEWCKTNKPKDMPKGEYKMFVKGLKQAVILIKEMKKTLN